MIDSIVIVIHNISSYGDLVDCLRNESEKGMKISKVVNPHFELLDTDTGEITPDKDSYLKIRQIEYEDTGKVMISYTNKVLTSSHYYLAYRVDPVRERLEFNFSVPKYVYGTNLIQFVTHDDEEYDKELRNSIEYQKEICFERLMKFIDRFLNDLFSDIVIEKKDIEVRRIDIAFNMIFKSKEDSLKYLEYQKRIRKTYISEETKNKHDWNTSVFISTERYSAKIYHKGSEYKSKNGERNHHLKINRTLKEEIFQVEDKKDEEGNIIKEGLQSYADRILRFEMTFRNEFMSNTYKNHLFAKDCEYFKIMKEGYKQVRAIIKRCETLEKLKKENDYVNSYKEFDDLSTEFKKNYSVCEKILRKRNSFRLEITKQEEWENSTVENLEIESNGEPKISSIALFSKELLIKLFDEFIDFKEQYIIRKLDDISVIGRKIASYNRMIDELNKSLKKDEKRRSYLNENRVKMLIMLMQHHSIDEMVKDGIISKRSKYNYLSKLKKIGIERNSFPDEEIDIEVCENYEEYYRCCRKSH